MRFSSASRNTASTTRPLHFPKLLADPNKLRKNLNAYVSAFSDSAGDIFERCDFGKQIALLSVFCG
jgi:type I restriction enzyme M protein